MHWLHFYAKSMQAFHLHAKSMDYLLMISALLHSNSYCIAYTLMLRALVTLLMLGEWFHASAIGALVTC